MFVSNDWFELIRALQSALSSAWWAVADPAHYLHSLYFPRELDSLRCYAPSWILLVLPSAFYIASHWGTVGIAACWIIVYPFVTLPLCRRVFQEIGMSIGKYFRAVWPPLSGTLAMPACVGILKLVLPSACPLYLRFAVKVPVGAVAYVFVMLRFHRTRVRAFYRLIRSVARLDCGHARRSRDSVLFDPARKAIPSRASEDVFGLGLWTFAWTLPSVRLEEVSSMVASVPVGPRRGSECG